MPAIPKPRPRMLERDERAAALDARDKRESQKVKARSGGRCEVTIGGVRCPCRAFEVHHHIGHWRLRGRGASALAENKSHVCSECHRLITGHVLVRLSGNRFDRRR